MSAILLPFDQDGGVDWPGFRGHLERTASAGLKPAVNMDTGYVQQLDLVTRSRVLDEARDVCGADFLAGAQVPDHAGTAFAPDRYRSELDAISERGGTPVIFPSHALGALADADWLAAHRELARSTDRFIAFELGSMFVPYGKILTLEGYAGLLEIPQCIGAKHSSLSRQLEWDRLALRDERRPEFQVLTGNDLAIDMVMYGSDYLLGLSTFAPEAFAARDRAWQAGDAAFYELNDWLQYLGFFAFRDPVPGYKHDAAQFLHMRGWIASSRTHPDSPERPASDLAVLQQIAQRLDELTGE
jgi:dihydrodipicolinate synthase/N-acetylneuraminate lyase